MNYYTVAILFSDKHIVLNIPHLMEDAFLPDGTRGNNKQIIDCFDENSEIYEMTSFLYINNSFITP